MRLSQSTLELKKIYIRRLGIEIYLKHGCTDRWVVQVVVSLAWHGEWRITLPTYLYQCKIEKPLSRLLEMHCYLLDN